MTRFKLFLAFSGLLIAATVRAENLDVAIITIKKFTVLENGGVKIPTGKDSYWDFLEITNTDNRPAVITGVGDLMNSKGCIITDDTQFPLQLPPKSTLEFTIRQDCGGVGGVAISLDGGLGGPPAIHQQRYFLAGPLMRLASPVFQARLQRSN